MATYWLNIAYFSYTPLSFGALAPHVLFGISRRRRSDGRTDGRTESIITNTALCIAYADRDAL